ncbi:hypothetical protein AN640_03175 [Candidatus Epulonipiscium fishelsonii]|uniref:Uncharacterized protein n=1 Tax=Candidatus Epulonipiscium fishelsonii TaxID=77094 RepID=A0ACC8XJN1_9FIRM|nr:hypothetical protein AN640_03175 [Epulopiscium sp. SCG-D08WGA-EpuloA1]
MFGNKVENNGVKFTIFSTDLNELELCIYDDINKPPVSKYYLNRGMNSDGNIFVKKVVEAKINQFYTWGANYEGNFHYLIDPYAQEVVQNKDGIYFNKITKLEDTLVKRPNIPWDQTIIYEMHIGNFTKSPTAKVKAPATFNSIIEKIPYFKVLGVTTIELLPIFLWYRDTIKSINPFTGFPPQDIWGYNSINFFALDPMYVEDKQNPREEFKRFVDIMHSNDLEVILDVVYNHTGEGGHGGSVFNFKALANDVYYRMIGEYYANCSGTGNTLNTSHAVVQEMIIDSLRYWIQEMGVDGFRFDLASILAQDESGKWIEHSLLKRISQDPILSQVKLISESWDAKGAYNVGFMPKPFHEWSDVFRNHIRRFIKGDNGLISDVATCIVGKEIAHNMPNACMPVHYITAHDGFTLWDLVSYNEKHNMANGEDNRDGSNNNCSWNSGLEGETSDPAINALRLTRLKTGLGLLIFSRGIPMIVMGDEGARTQQGNNNAFCQDNELSWLNWERTDKFKNIFEFVAKAISLRKSMKWFGSDISPVWHGTKLNSPDWSFESRILAWSIQEGNFTVYFVANNYSEELSFEIFIPRNRWEVYISSDEGSFTYNSYIAKPFSFTVLIDRF